MPEYSNNDVITFWELKSALSHMKLMKLNPFFLDSTSEPREVAEKIFETVLKFRHPTAEQSGLEHITKEQLKVALEAAGYSAEIGYIVRRTHQGSNIHLTAEDAASVIWDAKNEPEYGQGEIWQDASGRLYKRHKDGWLMFGSFPYSHDVPERPLKKVTITT